MSDTQTPQKALFSKPRCPKPDLEIGQVVMRDGSPYRVVYLMPVMRPFLKTDQDTYPVGWTVGYAPLPKDS